MPAQLTSIDDARALVLGHVRRLGGEQVAAASALGRVLAEDITAAFDLPPFRSSAMDGFALVAGAAAELPVVGESRAGRPFEGTLQAGEAVRISTGGVVPEGADAVVPIERVEELDGQVRVPDTRTGANVRDAGEDVRAGEVVLRRGGLLGPPELAMLAALGRSAVECARRPRLAVLATGDELRSVGEELGPGQIHDSNAVAIAAQATVAGAQVVSGAIVRDERTATREALERALGAADVLCISGGVSVGPHDHVRPALAELGIEQLLWGVRLKPGKPFWFGVRGGNEPRLVFGLPGNPVSASVTFRLFVHPAVRAMQGADPSAMRSTALLDEPVELAPDREQAVRCRLRADDDGFHVAPTGPQGSHVISSMLGARALALVPPGDGELGAGQRVVIELL